MGRVLGQLREPTAKALRALHLDCRLDEAFGASGIPWASLPKLQTLTCSARYVGTLKMELIHLAIPHNHPLEQLGLAHYVKDGWQPEDAALKELSLPRLRTLDLRQLDALNPEFVPAMVTSFDEALGDRTKWPSLQQMVLPAYTFAPDLRAGLMGVAARHGLQLVPAPPTRDPLSP